MGLVVIINNFMSGARLTSHHSTRSSKLVLKKILTINRACNTRRKQNKNKQKNTKNFRKIEKK